LIDKSLRTNSDEIIDKSCKRISYHTSQIDPHGDMFENSLIEDKIFNIIELRKTATLASKQNPDINVKEISNILSQHGSQNYTKSS
jgi:hypothetical protein